MKLVSWVVGLAAVIASGAYLLVYVYRWEWHRALLVGILFIAGLVALCTALVLRRLGRLEQQLQRAAAPGAHSPGPLERLRQAPVETPPFRWLRPEQLDRSHVFIPILLGGGVLVSGVAWLIERMAGSSARAGIEAQLAGELRDVAFPTGSLVPARGEVLAGGGHRDDPALRLLLGPASGRGAA